MTIGLRLRIRKLLVRSSDGRVVLRALVVLSLSFLIESSSLRAQNPTSILEEIEWTWEVRPQRADPKFPNVLVGDSITRNYFPQVTEDLRGVVHFNNGMHGWGYTDHNSSLNFPRSFEPFGPFRVAASSYGPPSLQQSSQRQPAAPPIPTSTRGVPSAQAFMEVEKIPGDDQHALLTQHPDLYEDGVHFNRVGSAIMGGHGATIIKRVLMTPGREGHGQD
jgi:hypothetical protein